MLGESRWDVGRPCNRVGRRRGWLIRLVVPSFPRCSDSPAFFEQLDEVVK